MSSRAFIIALPLLFVGVLILGMWLNVKAWDRRMCGDNATCLQALRR